MSKRYDEPIEVEVGELKPVAFRWRGRSYSVSRLIKYWREAGRGWDPGNARDHECFRVEAGGGTYDLRRDLAGTSPAEWKLLRVWD